MYELPQTKYTIGQELYQVNGMECFAFKVSAINFVMLNDETINYQYLCEEPTTKKVIRATEETLFATWEEAKAAMKATLEIVVENARVKLDTCVDPYELKDENV